MDEIPGESPGPAKVRAKLRAKSVSKVKPWGVCVCLLLQDLRIQSCVCVFITAGPMIKLCAGGEGDSEGHVL